MKLSRSLALIGFVSTAVGVAYAQHGHEGGHEGGHEVVHAPAPARPLPPRPEPRAWQAHPPGPHPHGPTVRSHPVRVLRPTVVRYGHGTWRHWEHPEFARPAYYWDWGGIHNVSCIAEDSYGDQYPVSEETWAGFGLVNMTAVEDDALDRCYQESGSDPSCYLATCSHF